MSDDAIKQLDGSFHCPKCSGEIEYIQDIQNPQPIKKGNIVVCGHCGVISQVGDSNLVQMTKAELDALDKQSKSMLALMTASVMGEIAKRKAGISGN
jgi:transcription elongation factor Elf1